jgi:hypothetical protein
MDKHHTIISGSGRTCTTFLVQLFTELGLETGFANRTEGIFENCNAGMEKDIRLPDAPYIIKSPLLCDRIDELVRQGIVIDHVIMPMRDLYSAAESRRYNDRNASQIPTRDLVPGGLWGTDNPLDQENVLARKVYELILAAARHDIPMTLLDHQRMGDPVYLYSKLRWLLSGIDEARFHEAFNETWKPELIHRY